MSVGFAPSRLLELRRLGAPEPAARSLEKRWYLQMRLSIDWLALRKEAEAVNLNTFSDEAGTVGRLERGVFLHD